MVENCSGVGKAGMASLQGIPYQKQQQQKRKIKKTKIKKTKTKKKKDNLVGSKEDMTRSLPELSPSSGIGKDPATSRSSRSLCPSTTGGAVPRRQPHSGHSPFRTP